MHTMVNMLKKQTESTYKLFLLVLKKETNLSHVKSVNPTSITMIDYLSKREGIAGKGNSRPHEGFLYRPIADKKKGTLFLLRAEYILASGYE